MHRARSGLFFFSLFSCPYRREEARRCFPLERFFSLRVEEREAWLAIFFFFPLSFPIHGRDERQITGAHPLLWPRFPFLCDRDVTYGINAPNTFFPSED